MLELLQILSSLKPSADPLACDNTFVGIEIGVEQGSLTRWVMQWFPRAKWHGIDPWAPYTADEYKSYDMKFDQRYWRQMHNQLTEDFNAQIIEQERLWLHKATSDDAIDFFADAGVDLVFVDGLHTEEQTARDIRNYWRTLRAGGIMCGHDIDNPVTPGVRKAVEAIGRPFTVRPGYLWVMEAKTSDDEEL